MSADNEVLNYLLTTSQFGASAIPIGGVQHRIQKATLHVYARCRARGSTWILIWENCTRLPVDLRQGPSCWLSSCPTGSRPRAGDRAARWAADRGCPRADNRRCVRVDVNTDNDVSVMRPLPAAATARSHELCGAIDGKHHMIAGASPDHATAAMLIGTR
jgi:hypothetical protein